MAMSYYIPVTSFIFPEVASAEALWPTQGDISGLFTGRNSYPTRITGDIPVNPSESALILYSEPVTYAYTDGQWMDYPLIISISDCAIDKSILKELHPPSLPPKIKAWAYPKTIFFEGFGVAKFVFRTIDEKRQQLDRIKPYSEVKNLALIEEQCTSFEENKLKPTLLQDNIKDEILDATSLITSANVYRAADLIKECRTGACLGYNILQPPKDLVKIDSCITQNGDEKTNKLFNLFKKVLKELLYHLSKNSGIDYSHQEIILKPNWGRSVEKTWAKLDSILKCIIDFIAEYSYQGWNWYGNEERYEFMRDLWNNVLKGELEKRGESTEKIDIIRHEVGNVCKFFKNPNAISLNTSDIHSPTIQALFVVLQSNGDAISLKHMMSDTLKPDYCLTLYGALRGYSYFSRILLSKDVFIKPRVIEEQPRKKKLQKTGEKNAPSLEWHKTALDAAKKILSNLKNTKKAMDNFIKCLSESNTPEELYTKLSEKDCWKKRWKVFKTQFEIGGNNQPAHKSFQKDLFDIPDDLKKPQNQILLCDDNDLIQALENDFSEYHNQLTEKVAAFCTKYQPGGYYYENSQKYKRENTDLIDHLLRCFKSEVTKELNFSFPSKDEENRFVIYLENRYNIPSKR